MGKFSDYLDSMKSQTDTLRDVVSEKSGVDCSEMSIGGVANVVKDIQTGGKDPVLQEKSVNPKTYSQEVTADEGYDGLSKISVGAVTSNIDANITPTNIRAGVSILGVQGNLSSDKPDQTKRVTPKTTEQSVFADAGYELGEVIVEAVTSDIDADIKASNIKRGINILGVDGTFDGGELQSKTVTPTTSEQNVTPDTGFYGLSGVKVNAVNPSDYYKDEEIVNVTPSTESQKITPTANKVFNEVNVSAVTSAIDANILADNIKKDVTILGVTGTLESGVAEDLTESKVAQDTAIADLESAVDKLPEPKPDRLQWKCDNVKTMQYEFYKYKGTSLDEVLTGLDTSQVTNMSRAFSECENINTIPYINTSKVIDMSYMFSKDWYLTTIPQLDTQNVTSMSFMFNECQRLTSIPQLDTSKVTTMQSMFNYCNNYLTAIPQLDTRNVTSMQNMFANCSKLTTISLIDMISATNVSNMFNYCTNLTNLTLKNIKVSLQIGSGTSYGHLLTDESLINTAKELWDFTGSSSKKLTLSTPSNARFDAIYVKLIEATADMIANDEYITNKKPCVVCESTDTGAMTLREYVISKNWTIA